MPVPGVVGAHDDVDEDGAGEDDGRPGRHVAGDSGVSDHSDKGKFCK